MKFSTLALFSLFSAVYALPSENEGELIEPEKGSTIDGLLGDAKTDAACPGGYGYCSETGVCCPLGGECCLCMFFSFLSTRLY